ncbi:HAD family hydrolase [Streptomyces sp. NPDC054766]
MTAKWLLSGVSDEENLRRVLDDAEVVLLDFDGPVCDLFGRTPTAHIADEIKVVARNEWGALDRDVEDCDDSHGILHHLRNMLDGDAPVSRGRAPLVQANTILTRHEHAAVRSAVAAPYVDALLNVLHDLGKRLAIVSNNAEEPIRSYLEGKGLRSRFAAVCGRDPYEPHHMKPHPDVVHRALADLGCPKPSRALLVGDQLTDLRAARAAGVAFIGYTQDGKRRLRMAHEGAAAVVSSHTQLTSAAQQLLDTCSDRSVRTEPK